MPLPLVSAVVIACDHFMPAPRRDPDDPPDVERYKDPLMYEFHVVVRLEGSGECVRLRTERSSPLRLLHFLSDATDMSEDFSTAAACIVARYFAVGNRIQFCIKQMPTACRLEELGYHPSDVAVDPTTIDRLYGKATSPVQEVLLREAVSA